MRPSSTHNKFSRSYRTSCKRHISLAATATAASKQQPDVQHLSTILLVNENLRRRIRRGLLESHQLLQAVELVHQADYALVVAKAPEGAVDVPQHLGIPGACQILYANAAAVQLLCSRGQQQLESAFLPSLTAADWQTAGATPQAQQQQQQQFQQSQQQHQQQQQSPCRDFNKVSWKYAANEELIIRQMLVCPVDAPNGTYLGLALLFDRWTHPSDGCIGAPGHPRVHPSDLPTEHQIQQAADAVRQQADTVRQLKQGRGLGNKDSEVVAAVAGLQQLRQELTGLESLQTTFHAKKYGVMQQLLEACQQS